jgi:hypothetical protein
MHHASGGGARALAAALAALAVAGTEPGCSGAVARPGADPCAGVTCGGGGGAFSFVVFGDLNGGGCERNARVSRLVDRMAAEPGVAFYVSTGDLVDGWVEAAGGTMCFGRDPAEACGTGPLGNLAALLAPIRERAPVGGLASSFYPTIGNHDDNWGSGWYPDPCGGGICDLLAPLAPGDLVNHPHGDLCSLDQASSAHGRDFYYSFTHQGSTFLFLRQNDDYDGMLSCNGHADCPAYCADPAHFADPARANDCYYVAQFDWLRAELAAASGRGDNLFVFGHAPLLGSGDNHGANGAAPQLRALLEAHGVAVYFNGHNHAYERTAPVRGAAVDPAGTTYLTVGPAGAPTDGVNGAWFTARSNGDWASYGDLESNTLYTRVAVDGRSISVQVFSLAGGATPVDSFTVR